jgi:hypothetical protein
MLDLLSGNIVPVREAKGGALQISLAGSSAVILVEPPRGEPPA